MKFLKFTLLLIALSTLTNCASGYKTINPKSIYYVSSHELDSVKLSYKYELLNKRYTKKEVKKGVKVVAVKLTNNSNKDLMFGRDIKLSYTDGTEIYVLESEKVYKTLKQKPATHLLYLLLTPVNFYTTKTTNGYTETTSSFPIGLILGPGLAGGNMIVAASANKNFKNEMLEYNINGTVIKKGETKYGLIGIKTDSFDALKLMLEPISENSATEETTTPQS